ncbi:MAG TPA: FmdB family zinc ribbon protein [Opitutales bacterium]|nr:FmdB family zinc ribbon protein [Opitutales bacterium]
MPICRYRPLQTPCKLCNDGFDHNQKASEPDLTECPTCGKAVEKVFPEGFGTPRLTRKPSISEAKEAGFTVLKRLSGGEYEKQ